jgi:hypothetical protein
VGNGERFGQRGTTPLKVAARERAPHPIELRRDLTADIAAIEVVEPGMGEVIEHCRQRRLDERAARLRGFGALNFEQSRE